MTRGTRRILSALLAVAVSLGILFPAAAPAARDVAGELRKERGRLLEMKEREEKTVRELTEALRKEKLSKGRVGELQALLTRQRSLLSRIDRKVSVLNERLEGTEKAVRDLDAAHGEARTDLRRAEVVAFAGQRAGSGNPWRPSARERERHFMRVYLAADAEGVARITRARERKEEELSGLERQVAVTVRKMARETKVGDTLLSRQGAERRRLADIGREKKRKEKELTSLRAKIARMESVVSRVERQVKARERLARKAAAGGSAAKGPAEAPRRFASLSGGLSAPLAGKVVTRFGRQHDTTFDVTIENRGVEIEAPSGASVKSVGQGEIAFAGGVSGFGKVLIVQHGGGLFSVYGRLETFLVKQGEAVKKGTVVGRLPGSPSGKSVLYLELRAGGTAIDPTSAIPLDR
ncbi:MAG: peptidoglycan DD-metalloendopeptidase family protein [Candidatus Deferrimicrobium sp.]|nr:peptidoglycan DD-metalloendopeptidase family protein [Candidatus Deferrimicrobium sp.]